MKLTKTLFLTTLCITLYVTLTEAKTKVTTQPFGKMPDGTSVDLYTLTDGPVEARITNYGGIIVSLKVRDKKGTADDVVLAFDNLDGYVTNNNPQCGAFFGASISG